MWKIFGVLLIATLAMLAINIVVFAIVFAMLRKAGDTSPAFIVAQKRADAKWYGNTGLIHYPAGSNSTGSETGPVLPESGR